MPDASGPGVIGATGGSGTRVFARIVMRGGMFIGSDLNVSSDALGMAGYADRWINTFSPEPAPRVSRKMAADLDRVLARHLARYGGELAWGWKEPRSIYLLPFLATRFPELRFLHVIRDGRDMALSDNQNQLARHGAAMLAVEERARSREVQSILLWQRVNLRAAALGDALPNGRYLRVRFEDLCSDRVRVVGDVLEFFRLHGDAEEIAASEVAPPASLGRWRHHDPRLIAQLEDAAGDALSAFGYR